MALTLFAASPRALAAPPTTRPAGMDVRRNLVYATRDGVDLHLDVFLPHNHTAEMKTPAILLLHGGGWRQGSKNDLASLGAGLAAVGFVAVPVEYRLVTATGNKFPAQLDDVQTAVRWIRANAGNFGIDGERLGAWGASAGGHLAALLGTEDTRDNSDPTLAKYASRVQAVVDLSGPTLFLNVSEATLSDKAREIVTDFLGKPPAEVPDLATLASPALHIDDQTAPMLIVHGTADPLVPISQAEVFYKMLKAKGRDATLLKLDGEGHGFSPEGNKHWLTEALLFFRDKLTKK